MSRYQQQLSAQDEKERHILALSPHRDALLWVKSEVLEPLKKQLFDQFSKHPMIPTGENFHHRIDGSQLVIMQARANALETLWQKILVATEKQAEFERKKREIEGAGS